MGTFRESGAMEAAKNLPIWEGRVRASDLFIGAASPLFRLSQPLFRLSQPLFASSNQFLRLSQPLFRLTCSAFCLSQPLLRLSQPHFPLLPTAFPPHLPGFLPRLIRFWCRTNANFPLRGPKNHLLWGISELQYPCFCPFMGEKQLLSDFSARFSVSRFLVFKSLYNRFLCGF